MSVKTDKVEEAIAKKLLGVGTVPPLEQARMIRRAAKVAKAEYNRGYDDGYKAGKEQGEVRP